jgi:DNA-binding response OmpR family regulator
MIDSLSLLFRLSGFEPVVCHDRQTLAARARSPLAAVIIETAVIEAELHSVVDDLRLGSPLTQPLLIALTYQTDAAHRRAVLKAGFDLYMAKGEEMGGLLGLLKTRSSAIVDGGESARN